MVFFFFSSRRRHTRLQGDWSSDVCSSDLGQLPGPGDLEAIDADPVRCLDPEASAAMVAEIDAAHKEGDTLGGVIEVVAHGLPPGLGSFVHWDRRLDGRLAGAMVSIHAIKAAEI